MPPPDWTSGFQERLRAAGRRVGDAELRCRQARALWKRSVVASETDVSTRVVGAAALAFRVLSQAEAALCSALDAERAIKDDLADARRYADRLQFHRQGFQRQYAGMGYQYDVLLERAAHAATQAERADEQGTAKEQREAAREVRESISVLQRYTEATKIAAIQKHVNEEVSRVILVFEGVFRDTTPDLWDSALRRLMEAQKERAG